MNKKVYDLLIIGSGPAACGILHGLPYSIKAALITHGKSDNYFRDSSGDLSYSNRFGGGLDMWHGVSSYELFLKNSIDSIDLCLNYFCRVYQENIDIASELLTDSIYIPNKKIDTKDLLSLIEEKCCDLIIDNVLTIDYSGKFISVNSSCSSFLAKKVIICAGAVGTMKILERSQLGVRQKLICNHINGYSNFNIDSDESFQKIIRGNNGHIKKIRKGICNDANYMIYQRPSIFDFKNKSTLRKFKSTYSKKSSGIKKIIAASCSPGLFFEAIYNRYGYCLGSSQANEYFQIECKGLYDLDERDQFIVHSDRLKLFVDGLRKFPEFAEIDESTIVSGIHFFNTVKAGKDVGSTLFHDESSLAKQIMIGDSSCLNEIGGTHHTFSNMALNYAAMRKIYG